MNIEAVIEALGTRFDSDEAAIAERMLREYGGTIPDEQLVSEIGRSRSTAGGAISFSGQGGALTVSGAAVFPPPGGWWPGGAPSSWAPPGHRFQGHAES